MSEPDWVTLLFDRGHGHGAVNGPFLLGLMQEMIGAHCDEAHFRMNELRTACLLRLDSDPLQALAFLSVSGIPSDLGIVDRFLISPDENVAKAAKVCRYEITHRRVG